MAEDIRKKIQIVIETVTEEAKSKIKDLDRAIDDLNRKTSSKAPAQRTSRTTDIKANKEEAESLKLLRAEMKAYVSAANVLNKRELTKSVKSGISSLPKSMKETADAIGDYTKRVETSYKTIEEAMGTMTPKQKEVFEQMIPQTKLQALKDYTSVTGKMLLRLLSGSTSCVSLGTVPGYWMSRSPPSVRHSVHS
jgi:predicted  nucleic acid-binding Zn-ribbon protein